MKSWNDMKKRLEEMEADSKKHGKPAAETAVPKPVRIKSGGEQQA